MGKGGKDSSRVVDDYTIADPIVEYDPNAVKKAITQVFVFNQVPHLHSGGFINDLYLKSFSHILACELQNK